MSWNYFLQLFWHVDISKEMEDLVHVVVVLFQDVCSSIVILCKATKGFFWIILLIHPPKIFRRRFRMHRHLFCRILSKVEEYDPYFVQRRNCAGTIGLSSLQKVTAAFRMLAYGVPADYVDEYVRIGETTVVESLQSFVSAVVNIFF